MRKLKIHWAFGEGKHLYAWARDPRCSISANALEQRVKFGTPLEAALVFSRAETVKGYWAFGEVRALALWLRDPRCTTPGAILKARLESGERFESAITRPADEPLLERPFDFDDVPGSILDLEQKWRIAKLTLWGETKTASKWGLDPRSEVNYTTLVTRIKAGWPLDDPVTIMRIRDVENCFTHRYAGFTSDGEDLGIFPNLSSAERAILALSDSGSVFDRITKREIPIPRPAKSAKNPGRRPVMVTAWGETKSREEWIRDPRCVVGSTTLMLRLSREKRKKWTPEDAMSTPAEVKFVSERTGVLTKTYEGFGETKTAVEWAADPRCKVPLTTLNRHLRKGMTVERALQSGHPLYTAFGESKTSGEWARDPRCKVTGAALRTRLSKGQPIEDALQGIRRGGRWVKRLQK